MKTPRFFAALLVACLFSLPACRLSFDSIRDLAMIHSGEVHVLESAGNASVLVTPALMGRVLTSKVGRVESVGFVSREEIEKGDRDVPFNNFGGQDRFWIGPESGQHGIYFGTGGEVSRENWQVPPGLNSGAMKVLEHSEEGNQLLLGRELILQNYSGTTFEVNVRRQIGVIAADKLNEEIGVPLPEGVDFVGSYSLNTMTNRGDQKWSRESGLLSIWILGQYNAGPRCFVIAPFRRSADESESLEPVYNDNYFGKVPAERLEVVGNAVLMRADARKESKFGLDPRRSTGLAGSYDPDKRLLVVVKFDVDPEEPLHANFEWGKKLDHPYEGDVLQTYNSGPSEPGELISPYPFYELESVSACKELAPNESINHRHATFAFTGDFDGLNEIAKTALGTDLEDAMAAFR